MSGVYLYWHLHGPSEGTLSIQVLRMMTQEHEEVLAGIATGQYLSTVIRSTFLDGSTWSRMELSGLERSAPWFRGHEWNVVVRRALALGVAA